MALFTAAVTSPVSSYIVYNLADQSPLTLASQPVTLIANQALASSALPSPLTIERIYGNPSLTGPSPKGLTISPDGSRLLYLQAKEEKDRNFKPRNELFLEKSSFLGLKFLSFNLIV